MSPSIKKNIVYLLLIQGGNYILPVLLFPYLGRVLGQEQFGVLAYCQAIIQYFIILTDFGFNLTATRRVAVVRDDPAALARVYSATMCVRLGFTLLSFALLLFGIFSLDKLNQYAWILSATFLSVLGSALFPIWLFQGLEQLKMLTLANLLSKALTLLGTLALVSQPDDTALAASCIGFGNLSLAMFALWLIHRQALVKFQRPAWGDVALAIKDSLPIFISTVVSSAYMNLNAILLENMHGVASVGAFSMADKIRLAIQGGVAVVAQAYYPRISLLMHREPQQAVKLLKNIFWKVGGIALLACLAVQWSASWLILSFLPKFDAAIPLLQLEAWLLPLIASALVYGHLGLITLGKAPQMSRIYVVVSLMHIAYAIPLTYYAGATGTVVSLLCTEALASLLIVGYFLRVQSRL